MGQPHEQCLVLRGLLQAQSVFVVSVLSRTAYKVQVFQRGLSMTSDPIVTKMEHSEHIFYQCQFGHQSWKLVQQKFSSLLPDKIILLMSTNDQKRVGQWHSKVQPVKT